MEKEFSFRDIALGSVGLFAWLGIWLGINLWFIQAGMLEPDFGVIEQALALNFTWMPIAGLGLGALLGGIGWMKKGRMRRVFWIGMGVLCFGISGFVFGLRFYMMEVEPERMQVRQLTLRSPEVSQPLRILHFSDVQSDRVGVYEERVFETIRQLDPDLIVYTGDWVQPIPPATVESEIEAMLKLIRSLNPRLGFYATYGDTDAAWYEVPAEAMKPLHMFGVRPVLIEWEGGVLALKGLGLFESRYPEVAQAGIDAWFSEVPDGAFSLLIGHSPDYVQAAGRHPIDLCLAGHTHGGQVRLPWIGPLLTDSLLPKRMSRGLHFWEATRIHVSSGLGTTHYGGLPALRFLCPPEMTVIQILPE